jgi:hypothetical protein
MKLPNPFRKPTAAARAAEELRIARLQRLEAQAGAEHFKHQAAMLDERIARLERMAGDTFAHAIWPGVAAGLGLDMRDHAHAGLERASKSPSIVEVGSTITVRGAEFEVQEVHMDFHVGRGPIVTVRAATPETEGAA